jgi:hypothetical protein
MRVIPGVKHPNKVFRILLALAPMLLGELVSDAQDWQTVDDFALGGGNAEAHGIAIDAAGGIYVVGTANGHGLVRYSADGGSSWLTRDDFVYPSETNNLFNAVTVDYQGSLFVGGAGGGHWIVRRSTDQGVTWETVDDFYRPFNPPEQPGTNGVVYSLSSDGQGRVYGAGPLILTHCPCYNTWWVRGSSIGGTNWDTKLALPSGYGGISQATCAGEDVYATGSADDGDNANLGLILRSSDHGATWTTNFEGIADFHTALTADPAGNLYSAGYSMTSTSLVWLVRLAARGGTNWTTLDSSSYQPSLGGLPLPDAQYPYAKSIAVDAAGNVCVTGELIKNLVTYDTNGGTTYSSEQSWFTRQYQAATGQWSTTDVFSYSTNKFGIALGAAIAPSGSVFTVGFGTSNSGQQRWLVRKSTPPSPIAQAKALEEEVNDLLARAAIASKPASVLLDLLDKIVAEMARGESPPVCNRLRTFSKKVQEFVRHGTLSQSDGEALLNGTDNLRLFLGCPEKQ